MLEAGEVHALAAWIGAEPVALRSESPPADPSWGEHLLVVSRTEDPDLGPTNALWRIHDRPGGPFIRDDIPLYVADDVEIGDVNEGRSADLEAENARIGARWNVNQMEGFVGTMGPRLNSLHHEHTWANDLEGESSDSNVLVFVR